MHYVNVCLSRRENLARVMYPGCVCECVYMWVHTEAGQVFIPVKQSAEVPWIVTIVLM